MSMPLLLAKYSIAGVINAIVSYIVIFACMQAGLSPILSNMLGFAAGLVTAFVQSRNWVFKSAGKVVDDWLRFMLVFALAFAANFFALREFLALGINAYLAQMLACTFYVGISFFLNARFVFRRRKS